MVIHTKLSEISLQLLPSTRDQGSHTGQEGIKIASNTSLTSLSGLNNITSVGAALEITSNTSLTNLSGLVKLTTVYGDLEIDNNALTSLSGLDNLITVSGEMTILSNNSLTSLSGLDNLISVGGNLYINRNDVLTSLSGLDNLTSVGEDLLISTNALTSLSGLYNLTSVGHMLNISYNDDLISLTGLDNLNTVGGDLNISYNNVLTGFCGLYTLLNTGGLSSSYIVINNALNPTQREIIDGGPCTIYTSDLTLSTQAQVDAFTYIEITGSLTIQGSDITDLTHLNSLTSVGGDLQLKDNILPWKVCRGWITLPPSGDIYIFLTMKP